MLLLIRRPFPPPAAPLPIPATATPAAASEALLVALSPQELQIVLEVAEASAG